MGLQGVTAEGRSLVILQSASCSADERWRREACLMHGTGVVDRNRLLVEAQVLELITYILHPSCVY